MNIKAVIKIILIIIKFFKIKIKIFSLISTDEAIVYRLSEEKYAENINLFLYKDHFSYIMKFELFTKLFAYKTFGKS